MGKKSKRVRGGAGISKRTTTVRSCAIRRAEYILHDLENWESEVVLAREKELLGICKQFQTHGRNIYLVLVKAHLDAENGSRDKVEQYLEVLVLIYDSVEPLKEDFSKPYCIACRLKIMRWQNLYITTAHGVFIHAANIGGSSKVEQSVCLPSNTNHGRSHYHKCC